MKLIKIFILLLVVSGITLTARAEPRKLVFSPHWLPQAQFSGYYVAKDQGFYEEAGLDVEIIHPSVERNVLEYIESGTADIISHFLVSVLKARENGLDMVNIAQLSQHGATIFVSRKESGVETLSDFNGKKVGIWLSGFEEIPEALIREHDLDVTWIPIIGVSNVFLDGGVDIITVMWYNEYYQLYLSGINKDEMNTFFLSDYGYNIPEDGLYVMEETLESRKEDLQAFVEATLRGWDYAAENKEYTVQIVVNMMRQANIPSNAAHQTWMLDRILELMSHEEKPIQRTELYLEDYHNTISILKELGVLRSVSDYDVFFRPVLPGVR